MTGISFLYSQLGGKGGRVAFCSRPATAASASADAVAAAVTRCRCRRCRRLRLRLRHRLSITFLLCFKRTLGNSEEFLSLPLPPPPLPPPPPSQRAFLLSLLRLRCSDVLWRILTTCCEQLPLFVSPGTGGWRAVTHTARKLG